MQYKITCRAHQRPIGQGGFYSATLSLNDREKYTLVYDCGSVSSCGRLSDEIDNFGDELGNSKLDLLVISHLDADHVNGVDRLLHISGGVRVVFLPYLSPLERVIYLMRYPNQSESYYQLVIDPVSTLQNSGAERIFLVGEGADGNNNQIEELDNIGPNDYERWQGVERLKLNTDKLVRDAKIENDHNAEYENISVPDAFGVTDAHSLILSGLWRFKMFQKQGLRAVLEKVFNAGNFATRPSNETPDERRCRELLRMIEKVLGVGNLSLQNILQALKIESKRKLLQDAYKTITPIHNDVSLCLWHGPLFDDKFYLRGHAHGVSALPAIAGTLTLSRHHDYSQRGSGTMLTGDLSLKGDTLTRFKNHYSIELPHTWLFQLPHRISISHFLLNRG